MKRKLMLPIVILTITALAVLCYILIANKKTAVKKDTFKNCVSSAQLNVQKYENLNFEECSIYPVQNISAATATAFSAEYDGTLASTKEGTEKVHEKTCALYKDVFGKDVYEVEYENSGTADSITCSDGDVYYNANAYHTFMIADNSRYIMPVSAISSRDVVYRLDENAEISGVAIGKLTLSEAIEKCDEVNEKYLSDFMIGDGLKVKTAYIITSNDGRKEFIIRYQQTYGGIALNEAGNFAHYDDGGCIRMNSVDYAVDEDGISCIRSFYGLIRGEDIETEDSFITFASACQLLSNYLAPYGVYDVESVSINYCAPDSYKGDKVSVTFKSMWCFLVKAGDMDEADVDPRVVMYVDMTDGSIYVVDSIENTAWFNLTDASTEN